MKKLSFLFAMVFAVSMAMGQNTSNTSEIVEEGVNQEATVDQQGVGDNTSLVTQQNANNVATVIQINPVFDGSGEDDDNLSTVLQTGKNNTATVSQTNDHGSGDYAGPGGVLEAYVEQSGDGNDAEQIQGPANQMGTSMASIVQGGNNNLAFQHQLKYSNQAFIDQSGNGNVAMQAQDTELPEEGSANYASITQSGNNNTSEQEQNGWSNDIVAVQSGNGNTASQTQLNSSWVSSSSVMQSGNNNSAYQASLGNLNNALIEQYSNGNRASQRQLSGDATPDGYPALNNAEIYQWGGNGNEAIQNQINEAGNVSNHAIIWQNGANNIATQGQWGGFNSSTISQTGNGHVANLTQSQSLTQ